MKNIIMLPVLLFAVVFLAGCGLWNRDGAIESEPVQEVVVGATETVNADVQRDFFDRQAADQENQQDQENRENADGQDGQVDGGQPDASQEEGLSRIDKTQEIVKAITQESPVTPAQAAPEKPRISPVTGPSIPEEEMRKILNDELIANGLNPRY